MFRGIAWITSGLYADFMSVENRTFRLRFAKTMGEGIVRKKGGKRRSVNGPPHIHS